MQKVIGSIWRSLLWRSVMVSTLVIFLIWSALLLVIYTGVEVGNEAMDPGGRREAVLQIAELLADRPVQRNALLQAFDGQQRQGDNAEDEASGQLLMVVRIGDDVIYASPGLSAVIPPVFSDRVEEVVRDGWRWHVLCGRRGDLSVCLQRKRYTVEQFLLPGGKLKGMLTLPLMVLPMVVLSLSLTVWWMLRPVRRTVREMQRTSLMSDLSLDARDVPTELRAFLLEIDEWRDRMTRIRQREMAFVANAAHELRTPLAAIQVNAGALEEGAALPSSKPYLTGMRNGVRRMTRVVEQLMSLLRSESRDGSLENVMQLNLMMVVQERLADLSVLAGNKSISLTMDAHAPVYVRGDREQMESIIDNLVGNSIKYCQAGASVHVGLFGYDSAVHLWVCDTGPGIPDVHKEAVFERFRRLDPDAEPGAGLGLSIVKAAVEAHQGTIRLLDHPQGPGLCVYITFKAATRTDGMDPSSRNERDGSTSPAPLC
ncbi:MAG: HAMP domain-containing sensor histidine kinase [Burkholderiaceae bacterium]